VIRRVLAAAFVLTCTVAAAAQTAPSRPKITGISHLAVYASDPAATDRYYRETLGAAKLADPENPNGARYAFNDVQFVEVLPLPAGAGINRLDHAAFNTDDAEEMRKFLAAKSWKTPAAVTKGADGSRWFGVTDPEGNKIQFVQPPRLPQTVAAPHVIGRHLIHVGILVHDRALEDTFYRDLLGFRPYWWGGMKEDKVDWVSQQTPDSHDWLEYMLESGPAGSAGASAMTQRLLGVLDHVSVGVPSVDEAQKTLIAENRLSGVHDDAPKTGRDGKRQFNMYDPDQTRIELMNFKATEKPCCSPFTADDPAE
jgi:catechol 2,3-dioxygenase-like lactoylglutathione lyase family enzyme